MIQHDKNMIRQGSQNMKNKRNHEKTRESIGNIRKHETHIIQHEKAKTPHLLQPQQKFTAFSIGGSMLHGENAGTLGMVPLIINPIYTLYSGYLLGISPFKGLLRGLNSWGTILRVPAFSLWMLQPLENPGYFLYKSTTWDGNCYPVERSSSWDFNIFPIERCWWFTEICDLAVFFTGWLLYMYIYIPSIFMCLCHQSMWHLPCSVLLWLFHSRRKSKLKFHQSKKMLILCLFTSMLTKPCLVATHFATRFQSTHFPSKKKDQQRALVIQLPGNSDHLHESLARFP